MRRSFTTSDFISAEPEAAEDDDPRTSLVNLADVMLVFACGLMLSLVSYWNLDVSSMQEIVQGEQMKEVRDIEEFDGEGAGGGGYVERGTVYQDPETGKYYMLQEGEEGDKKTKDTDKKANEGDSKKENSEDTKEGTKDEK